MTKILASIPRYCLYTLLIFTPLARASVQGWAITTIHMITLIALTTFLLDRVLAGRLEWIKTPLDKPILALMILCIISTIFSIHRRTSIWSTILLLNYIVIFYLVIHTIQTRSQLRHLVYLIIGMATFLAIFGFFKRAGVNPFPWWDYADLPHRVRLTSTFGNPDHLAGYMEMAIPLLLGVFLFHHMTAKRFLLVFLTFFLLTALALSLSRGAWFSMSIGLLFMPICLLLDRHFTHKRLVAGLMAGAVAVALIVGVSTPVVIRVLTVTEEGVEPNLQNRMLIWHGVTGMINEHPGLGSGLGTFSFAFLRHQPPGQKTHFTMAHNDYIHFVAEAGLILIAVMIWMMIAIYRKGFQKLKNPSRLVRGITLGAMAGVTAILIHSVVDFNLHIPSNALLFTLIAALIVVPTTASNSLEHR